MAYIGKGLGGQGVRTRYYYTATGGETSLSGADDNSRVLSFADGEYVDVYLNGVLLVNSEDYNTTTANTISGLAALDADDIVEIVVYDIFSIYNNTINGTFTVNGGSTTLNGDLTTSGTLDANGNVDVAGDTTMTGDLTVDTDTLYVDSTNDRVAFGGNDTTTASSLANIVLGEYADTSSGAVLRAGTASAINFEDSSGSTAARLYYNHGSDYMAFNTAATERMRIDSNGQVGIGTTSPSQLLHAYSNTTSSKRLRIQNGEGYADFAADNGGVKIFANNSTQTLTIDSSRNFLFKTTNTNPPYNNVQGASFRDAAGQMLINAGSAHVIGRTGDGNVVEWYSGGNKEGQVSISGSTVSYGGFTGSHWSRLSDNTKPTILRGTVLESIGTMMDWYYAEFTTGSGDDAQTHKVSCAQPANKNVGDTFDFVVAADNEQGIAAGTYSATLRLEDDMKHVKVKVSDTSETKAIYGVFGSWDDEDDTVNDMNVSSLGTYVVRVNSGETVAIGDLLDSNGDGTAKVQSDDLIRSRTIGKVLSTVKQETYDDGSYTVPCALYCG